MGTLTKKELTDFLKRQKRLLIIPDYNVLQERWESSDSGSELEEQIEAEMMELNTADLPTITDYSVLQERWGYSSFDSELREQIEAKMLELLSLISDTNKPEEFVTLVKATVFKNLPEFFKQPLKEKINSLVK